MTKGFSLISVKSAFFFFPPFREKPLFRIQPEIMFPIQLRSDPLTSVSPTSCVWQWRERESVSSQNARRPANPRFFFHCPLRRSLISVYVAGVFLSVIQSDGPAFQQLDKIENNCRFIRAFYPVGVDYATRGCEFQSWTDRVT